MKKVSIKGPFESVKQLHEALSEKLGLPDDYGHNLDALWDCITGDIELPLCLEFINFEDTKNNLGDYCDELKALLEEAEDEDIGFRFVLA